MRALRAAAVFAVGLAIGAALMPRPAAAGGEDVSIRQARALEAIAEGVRDASRQRDKVECVCKCEGGR
jgi:hypothetical protein